MYLSLKYPVESLNCPKKKSPLRFTHSNLTSSLHQTPGNYRSVCPSVVLSFSECPINGITQYLNFLHFFNTTSINYRSILFFLWLSSRHLGLIHNFVWLDGRFLFNLRIVFHPT